MKENKRKHILICNCKGERINSDLLHSAVDCAGKLDAEVTIVNDLCGVAQENREEIAGILSKSERDYLILGCYRRTMDLLLEKVQGGQLVNLVETSEEDVLRKLSEFAPAGQKGTLKEVNQVSDWPSWYPIIDYSRCTSCGQCADFCLFGVYEKTDARISVVNPKGCKTNCPACARICPSAAIIFPKYKNGGAVGGSDLVDEAGEHRRQLQDIENLLGSNIYEALQNRKAKRQSIIREEAMKRAYDERDKALKEGNKQ